LGILQDPATVDSGSLTDPSGALHSSDRKQVSWLDEEYQSLRRRLAFDSMAAKNIQDSMADLEKEPAFLCNWNTISIVFVLSMVEAQMIV
jgi:hypothetical protein